MSALVIPLERALVSKHCTCRRGWSHFERLFLFNEQRSVIPQIKHTASPQRLQTSSQQFILIIFKGSGEKNISWKVHRNVKMQEVSSGAALSLRVIRTTRSTLYIDIRSKVRGLYRSGTRARSVFPRNDNCRTKKKYLSISIVQLVVLVCSYCMRACSNFSVIVS